MHAYVMRSVSDAATQLSYLRHNSTLEQGGVSVTIQFNSSLLRGDTIESKGDPMEGLLDRSAMAACGGDPLW